MSSPWPNFGLLPLPDIHALEQILGNGDLAVIGIVLTGSAARDMATKYSDVDIMVIRNEIENTRQVSRSQAIDEISLTLTELETVKPLGSEGAWNRRSYAWARVLHDSSGGRVTRAVELQERYNGRQFSTTKRFMSCCSVGHAS
ncbi:hypothetical protein H072_6509 [Dactylellina haptotyla CBS 200.50]|uniref:Polymerase nucleotidyl transferase domain-containing protein n=1 Tax=Dactylellina haptotyla (strain CBS 200.50) TaxID=1284197 RepID=S8A9X0_DACHA|nr:hypothetical protein H072_6509 [Dactylellina haptotyla CBS 200.50]